MKIAYRTRLRFATYVPFALACLGGVACSNSGDTGRQAPTSEDVVKNYAAMLAANYGDALGTAIELHGAVHDFTDAPSAVTLKKARDAWLTSRTPYGQSEAYRFYQGPIDNDDTTDDIPDGPEGLMNSWPLDESYIDYVAGDKDVLLNGGIVNLPDQFPEIDAKVLSDANAKEGETSISTGYHAIEFLLWGQDLSVDGPGDRPYTDYVSGADGTAENQARRAQYLLAVSDLLVDNLTDVNSAWTAGDENYRADFLAMNPQEALGKMLLGMGSLSGAELSGERMKVAYDNKDREDEQSCFSDNTLNDLHDNATSVQNVLLGRYGDIDGPGIDELVEARDPALAKKLREQIQDAIDNIDAVAPPFDQAILGDDDTPDRKHILTAIQALQSFTQTLVDAAKTLSLDLKLDE
jgi:putative iron-regulated protein